MTRDESRDVFIVAHGLNEARANGYNEHAVVVTNNYGMAIIKPCVRFAPHADLVSAELEQVRLRETLVRFLAIAGWEPREIDRIVSGDDIDGDHIAPLQLELDHARWERDVAQVNYQDVGVKWAEAERDKHEALARVRELERTLCRLESLGREIAVSLGANSLPAGNSDVEEAIKRRVHTLEPLAKAYREIGEARMIARDEESYFTTQQVVHLLDRAAEFVKKGQAQ